MIQYDRMWWNRPTAFFFFLKKKGFHYNSYVGGSWSRRLYLSETDAENEIK